MPRVTWGNDFAVNSRVGHIHIPVRTTVLPVLAGRSGDMVTV